MFSKTKRLFSSCFGLGLLESEPYYAEAKIVLCGTETSGKTELFMYFAHQNPLEPAISAKPITRARDGSSGLSLVSRPDDLEAPLDPAHDSSNSVVEKTGIWRGEDKDLAVMMTRPWFDTSRAVLIDAPAPARFDHQFLQGCQGTLCYVIALDEFDQVDSETGMNMVEKELENLFKIAKQVHLPSGRYLTVILNKLDVFEQKLRAGGLNRLKSLAPSMLPPSTELSESLTAPEITRIVEEYLTKRISQKTSDVPRVYVFGSNSLDSSRDAFLRMSRSVFLASELASAGFLS